MSIMQGTETSALLSSDQIRITSSMKFGKPERQLKKSLGYFDVFVYIVSSIIGAGIFVSPGLVARYTNNMGTSLIIWTVSGIVCLLSSLCFCELAISLKKTGNQYLFIKEAFGELAGFCAIWAQTLIVYPMGATVLSVTIGEHIVGMFTEITSENGQLLVKIIAILCTVGSILINCVSTSFSAKAQAFLGAVQVLGLILFICIGIWNVSNGETQNFKIMFKSNGNDIVDFNSLSLAFVSAMFSYDGWGGTASLNEELRDVNRNLTLGILTGMPFVIICFILFNLALMSTLTHMEMGSSVTVATEFIKKSLGDKYSVIVPIIVALSCFGSLNSTLMFESRCILSAAREGHLPKPLSYIHKERCTPIPALFCHVSLTVICILSFGSQLVSLLTYFSLGIWLTFGAALFGVIVLRIRRPDLERPYKVWLILPVITTTVSCYIIVAPFFKSPIQCVSCLCVILTAVPVYYLVHYCIPDCVKNRKILIYCWILDKFHLAECVFELNKQAAEPDVKESEF